MNARGNMVRNMANFLRIIATFLVIHNQCFLTVAMTISANNTEPGLLEYLFANNSAEVRPVLNNADPVVVRMGLMLRQIIDVDEKNQIITTNVWIRLYWKNPLLQWDPAKFGGIKSINVEPSKVWVPDILLYNAASTDLRVGSIYKKIDTKVIISNKGSMAWLAPAILKTECRVDIRNFPFDEQTCPMKFGSWTHNGLHIDIQPYQAFGMDVEEYSKNREWLLRSAQGERKVTQYNCCPEPYPTLTFYIVIRRRAMFYVFNLVLPCGLIALLSLFSFYLPPNSGERVSFVITVLLAMSVYMLMVTENMPQSSEIPLVSKFFMAVMCQISLSLAATCLIIKFSNAKEAMPQFIRLLVNNWLARLVLIKPLLPPKSSANSSHPESDDNHKDKDITNVDLPIMDAFETTLEHLPKRIPQTPKKNHGTLNNNEDTMNRVVNELKVLTNKIHKEDLEKKILDEWIYAADVMDRFFMLLFSLTLIITCISIFASSPYVSLE